MTDKRKLFIILASVVILNALTFQLSPGLGGNYLKNINSQLWAVPFGCIIWGFLLALPLTLMPINRLPYRTKYLIVALSTSILLNLIMFIVGVSLYFE